MRIRRIIAACGLVAASTVTVVGFAGSPAFAASCPDNDWVSRDGRTGNYFDGNGINIRTGPSTGCTSVGQGQASHQVKLDCYKPGEGGTWSHIWDDTTSRGGWVKDSLLVGNGANRRC